MNTLRRSLPSRSRRTKPAFSSRSTTPVIARRRETRQFREPARGHAPLEVDEIDALHVGTRNARAIGDGIFAKQGPCEEALRIAFSSSCNSVTRVFVLDKGLPYILVNIYLRC